MRITFMNQKGGVGKTTITLLIAAALKSQNWDVSIDDRDPQNSATLAATEWLKIPLYDPKSPTETIITDTPGHLLLEGQTMEEASELIEMSDKIVLVTDKSMASIHGSYSMARLILEKKRPDAKAYVLFNKVRAGTITARQKGSKIAKEFGLQCLKNELPLSTAYEQAYTYGLDAVTGKHRQLLAELAIEIIR